MNNNLNNLTHEQKTRLLALAEIADKGEVAIIQKLFEFEDYFNQFKDSVSGFTGDVNDLKTKFKELETLLNTSTSAINSEVKKIIDEINYSLSDSEILTNEKINLLEKKTLGFIKDLSARLTAEIDRIEREIPVLTPEVNLTPINDKIINLESKIDNFKQSIKEETGDTIVNKINSLPVDENANKIKPEHIEGYEKEIRDLKYRVTQSQGGKFGGYSGLSQVYHDSTLSGAGTQSSPLTVLGGGTWYQDEIVATGVTGTTFSLLNTPTNIVFLYLNGQYLVSGVGKDYTRSGKNITLATTILSTDILTANYS